MSSSEAATGDARVLNLAAISGVDIEPAPDAAVCGASSCTTAEKLVRGVIVGVGQRVLCGRHMAALVKREVMG